MNELPASWRSALADALEHESFRALSAFVAEERTLSDVFPPADRVFAAFALTPLPSVRVLLLGQDPYHDHGQAHGLCFSVEKGVAIPPSLRNMYAELEADLGHPPASHGHLASWAEQGVLMLNAVLTVRAHQPNSHKDKGWERFTDAVIRAVNDKPEPVVFVLWGGYAKKKKKLVTAPHHVVIESAHPSPLSARSGFFGSKPFSKINAALRAAGTPEIDWRIR
jgi:uracil-DNA glycosylase